MRQCIVALMLITVTIVSNAATPREIEWSDLLPTTQVFEDPFIDFTETELEDLSQAAELLSDVHRGIISRDSAEYREVMAILERLKARDIDTDQLLPLIAKRDAQLERYGATIREELNDTVVRIPGYALPLESSDLGVTALLLVPYVGACIHVPPPPPNQIVYVTVTNPTELKGLYEPVWITGRIKTQEGSRSLSFIDGEADVMSGYSIHEADIEPYE